MLYYFALVVFLMLAEGFRRQYFARHKFDMSYWSFVFPLDAFALASAFYHYSIYYKNGLPHDNHFTEAILYLSLIACSGTTAVCTLLTFTALLRRRIFTPDIKWAPLSFMKLTHEAFRGFFPFFEASITNLSPKLSESYTVSHWGAEQKKDEEVGR